VTLGIVYHMPMWQDADGTLREVEGSFARYVDSLAPYFDDISLCVPVLAAPRGQGTAIRARNVTLAPLPAFDGPVHFYPQLPRIFPRIARWVRRIDVLHCRIPSPAAVFAYTCARLWGRPSFVLIVGDLEALLPTMPYTGMKRVLWRAYTAFEERNVQRMANGSVAFANGAALARKHSRPHHAVLETTTTTIGHDSIGGRDDTCTQRPVRVLTVSRIDPRKGLRVLPASLAVLTAAGSDVTVDIVGPPVGRPGEQEQRSIEDEAERLGVGSRLRFRGAVALESLLPLYRQFDLFVLPTLPGEGIPRVLLEAMANGLPVVTTNVAGIPSLITPDVNGLLVDATADAIAGAIRRLMDDAPLRRGLIARGYATAHAFTLEAQAARLMQEVSRSLRLELRGPAPSPVASRR
jgi:glycosyltransferase involved in cell wall biosynthesis